MNSELSYEISRLGHTGSITLADAGLPIPASVKRIDLAIERGYPSLLATLDVMLSELMVEEIVLASELRQDNPQMIEAIIECFERQGMQPVVTEVEHAEFKRISSESQAIVRTGECTPYANIILKSGVVF